MLRRSPVALAAVVSLAACTADDPAPRATAADEATRAQVLAAYDGYQRTLTAALRTGDAEAVALAEFAAEPLLSQTRNSIRQMQEAGVVGAKLLAGQWSIVSTDGDWTRSC